MRSRFYFRLAMVGVLVFGGLVACSGDDGATDASADSAPSDTGRADTGPSLTCEAIGGTCACAGSCDPGTHEDPASASLCPQPCDDCGGCSMGCCVPDDAGMDAGADADAGCDVVAWSTSEVFRISGTCGPGVDEGTNLCLEITVSATGVITEAGAGPSSDQSPDATQATCIRTELVGRCVPSLAGQPANEQCAIGF